MNKLTVHFEENSETGEVRAFFEEISMSSIGRTKVEAFVNLALLLRDYAAPALEGSHRTR